MTREQDIPKPAPYGQWTVISPALPKSTLMTNEWPQGWSNAYLTTTKVSYEGGYELWVVQSTKEGSALTIWFYEQDWNVAPIINRELLSLKFPKQAHTTEEVKDK